MKKNGKVIYIVIFLMVVVVIILSPQKEQMTIEGIVVDIFQYEDNIKRPILLIEKDNIPYSVSFDRDINLNKQKIKLNDKVSIKTNGIVRESYPAQITGYDIKLIKKAEILVNKNIEFYMFNGSGYYENDILNPDYYRFHTVIFSSKDEYLNFSTKRGIVLPINDNLDKIFEEKVLVIAYAYMSSTPKLNYSKTYKFNRKIIIQMDIISDRIVNDDLVFRGVAIILDKQYVLNSDIKTLSEYLVLKEK